MTDPMGSRSKLRLSVYFFGSPTLPSKATTLNLTKTAINNEKTTLCGGRAPYNTTAINTIHIR